MLKKGNPVVDESVEKVGFQTEMMNPQVEVITPWRVCVLWWIRKATTRPNRQFVPSDNSSQATIRPKRQFVPSDNSSQATIRPKRQFVPSDNSSQATIRPKRQFVPSDNSSQATIRPKQQFVPIWKGDNSSQLLKAAIRPQLNCQLLPINSALFVKLDNLLLPSSVF